MAIRGHSPHRHQFIIGNFKIPLFFRFTQNPNKMSISMEKLYKDTQTIGGYVFEMWGRKPFTMSCDVLIKKDGSMDQLIGLNMDNTGLDLEDPMFCPEIFTLQTLFNLDQRRIKQSSVAKSLTSWLPGNNTAIGNVVKNTNTLKNQQITTETYSAPAPTSFNGYLSTFTDTIIYYKGIIYTGFFTKLSIDDEGDKPFRYKVHFDFLCTGYFYDWLYENIAAGTEIAADVVSIWGAASSISTLSGLVADMWSMVSGGINGAINKFH